MHWDFFKDSVTSTLVNETLIIFGELTVFVELNGKPSGLNSK